EVLAVGGSSRMPMVLRMLRDVSGKEPNCSLPPGEAVAHGAAIHAAIRAVDLWDARTPEQKASTKAAPIEPELVDEPAGIDAHDPFAAIEANQDPLPVDGITNPVDDWEDDEVADGEPDDEAR